MSDGPYITLGQPKAAFHSIGAGHAQRADRPARIQQYLGKQVEFRGADFHEYRDARACSTRIARHDGRDAPARPDAEARLTRREGRCRAQRLERRQSG